MPSPTFGAMGTSVEGYGLTSIAIPKPTGTASGHGLLVFLTKESTAGVTPPAGFLELGTGAFTSVPVGETSPVGLQCFWKRAGGSEAANYEFEWTGGAYARGVAARFVGVAPTGAFVDVYDAEQRSSNGVATPNVAVTTTGANRLLVWAGANWGGGAWTPPATFSERYDSGATLAVATKEQVASGVSGDISGSCGSDSYACGFLVALSDVPIGGGGSPVTNRGLLPLLMMS